MSAVLAAIAVAGIPVAREVREREATVRPTGDSRFIDDWEALLPNTVRTQPGSAAVTVIEVADFECPFCARFHAEIEGWSEQDTEDVEFAFLHYPLPQHEHAVAAAQAAECADEQGRFAAMSTELFASQRAFATDPWDSLAMRARVADMEQFRDCRARRSFPRIDSGVRTAERIRVPGTPSFIVNGWLLSGISADSLRDFILNAQGRR